MKKFLCCFFFRIKKRLHIFFPVKKITAISVVALSLLILFVNTVAAATSKTETSLFDVPISQFVN